MNKKRLFSISFSAPRPKTSAALNCTTNSTTHLNSSFMNNTFRTEPRPNLLRLCQEFNTSLMNETMMSNCTSSNNNDTSFATPGRKKFVINLFPGSGKKSQRPNDNSMFASATSSESASTSFIKI